jgi:hypothetical protein
MQIIEMEKEGKKVYQILVETEKEKEPKIMKGINEIVLLISVVDDDTIKKPPHNKVSMSKTLMMYEMLDKGVPIPEIADQLQLSDKTIKNYEKIWKTDIEQH